MRIAPLTRRDAESMLSEIRAHQILDEFRGMNEADRGALAYILLQLSALVTACPRIRELDINPLMVPGKEHPCIAVDARMVVVKE
jgi:hypothetical protein